MTGTNVLLTSSGRRPYLIEWFKDAVRAQGGGGTVFAADADTESPARAFADEFLEAPRVDDPEYDAWLSNTLSENEIDLAVSINDFELSHWSTLPDNDVFAPLVRLTPAVQALAEDKFLMGVRLEEFGVKAPKTMLASEWSDSNDSPQVVLKGRFGSASRGLRIIPANEFKEAVRDSAREVTTRTGGRPVDSEALGHVVVQPRIHGVEYGLDVVSDLDGNYAGVLARRKIAMRAGETDRAETVDSSRFEELAELLAEAVPHPGTMDVDVIVDDAGGVWVIDINPRFGGGYPLSHVAGADVPAAYVAWSRSGAPSSDCLQSQSGVVAGKYVGVARI